MPRILIALAATLIIGSSAAATADGNFLSGAIREASGLAPAYQFAQRCAADGQISATALSTYRNRLLSALEEKYTLDFDQVTLAEAFLTGESTSTMPLVFPSAGSDGSSNCAAATNMM